MSDYRKRKQRAKTPTILQMESTECGAASLAMILAYYRLWVPLEKLREECGVGRDGSKASNIMRAAKNRGFEVHGFKWDAENLRTDASFPLIIYWEFNHFLVLEGIVKNTVYLNDPAIGKRSVDWEEFLKSYTGIAITIEPSKDFKPEGRKFGVFDILEEKIRQDKWSAFFLLLAGICSIIPSLVLPITIMIFIDEVLLYNRVELVDSLIIIILIALAISILLNYLRSSTLIKWRRKFTLSTSSKLFWHLLRLPMKFFYQRYAAEIARRVNINAAISKILLLNLSSVALDLFVAIFLLVVMFCYNPTLTVISAFFAVINLLMLILAKRRLKDISMRIEQDKSKEYALAADGLSMMDSIKANGKEGEFFAKLAGYRAKILSNSQEFQNHLHKTTFVSLLLASVNAAVIITAGGFSVMEGVMTAGTLVAFQRFADKIQEVIAKLPKIFDDLQSVEIQTRRLNDVFCYERDKLNFDDKPAGSLPKSYRLLGELELKNITFGYNLLEPPLISNFNLKVSPGRRIAITGASGSGKSTVAKIITGLFEAWSGDVLFDGKSRGEIPRDVITASVSSVDQEIFLISGTIRENISLFDKSLRQSDIIQAAKDACIHEDILKLEGGYEAKIEEGGLNFSGGQRQRIEIARALSVNPTLLILDEATSALDPITEEKILDNIRHHGRSCVIIAHRLSTIRDCDEIIVLDGGKVA